VTPGAPPPAFWYDEGVPSTLSSSRLLSLRAPIAGEEERAQFQRRLSLTLFVIFVLAAGFFLVQLAIVAAVAPVHVHHMFGHPSGRIQLATTFVTLMGAVLLRRGAPSARALDVADAVLTTTVCFGWAFMIWFAEPEMQRPELAALLATSYTLATRAALVPSTPARSALLGLAGMAPLVPVTVHLGGVSDGLALYPAIYLSIWAAVGVACTTTISHIIYGLRLQVQKAMQLGQYLLEDKIGEGGMGVVYRARHAMLRRPTAIKLLTGTSGAAAERFEREVQMTARLTHPNTVAVFDYGRTPDGVFYYAMELLDGISLEDLVDEHGPQPIPRVVHILLQVCGALEEAHAAGLVHRDIKPANIMLTERGGIPDVVKVLDFGLVKESERGPDPSMSSTNTILGTPHYMAPEAIADPTKVDLRTDLYALGATAYFLLVGQRVFDGANLVEVCSQHLHQPPPSPSAKRAEIPLALEDVVLACLAKDANDRPRDAAALADRLRACNVPEWTRDEARAWWARATPSLQARKRRSDPTGSAELADALGKTITVALDGRAAE